MTDWGRFYAATSSRAARPLCLEALDLAGPGAGRLAVDLGCGVGVESAAMLAGGWQVLAVDSADGTRGRVRAAAAPGDRGRLHVAEAPFDELAGLPDAGLVYSGFALPFQTARSFGQLWALMRRSLVPGGWLAVNLFGVRDSWAGDPQMTFHTEAQARALLAGLDVIAFREDERDGSAVSGPKHWHTFDVIARA